MIREHLKINLKRS